MPSSSLITVLRSPYWDIGRPTLWSGPDFPPVDFLLESRSDGRRYVAEQKGEMAWSSYRGARSWHGRSALGDRLPSSRLLLTIAGVTILMGITAEALYQNA